MITLFDQRIQASLQRILDILEHWLRIYLAYEEIHLRFVSKLDIRCLLVANRFDNAFNLDVVTSNTNY